VLTARAVRAARNGAVRAFGTVAMGAAAAAGALSLTKQRQGVAAKELFNSLVGETDPTKLLPGKARARAGRCARRRSQLPACAPARRSRPASRQPPPQARHIPSLVCGAYSALFPGVRARRYLTSPPPLCRARRVAQMAVLNEKFGVDLRTAFSSDLCELYDLYLTSVLPSGDAALEGWEVGAVRAFKDALGLEDQDAAGVHLEVGRRIFRSRMEQGDKSAESEARKEFQKLVFLSNLVFGAAKASFLLPWKRVFSITDAQISVAVRDSAAKLYKDKINALLPGGDVSRGALAALEAYRTEIALDAEPAAEQLVGATRGRVEAAAARAYEGLKARTRARDVSAALTELDGILAYNAALRELAAAPEGLPPGVGPVSLFGGVYEADAKMGELRDLFRMFFAERVKDGAVSDDTVARAAELRTAFGMGAKEADAIAADVTTKVYRMQLKKALDDGVLAAAPSPARALQALCDALRFSPPAAEAINMELYRTKLEASMAGGSLSDEAEAELQALRRLLCVPAAADKAARKEVCGDVFKKTLAIALGAGADGFSSDLRDKVLRVRTETRLDEDTAVELLGDMVRKVWLAFVRDSRNKANRLDAAKELKNLVLFNAAVVTPLVTAIRGSKRAAAAAEIADLIKEAQAMAAVEDADTAALEKEWAAAWTGACVAAGVTPASAAVVDVSAKAASDAADVSSLNKVASAMAAEEAPAQKEITLANDLPLSQRTELYRQFLLFCMTGDQVYAPMGSTITIERDQSEFVRLSQLGDVLGLNPMEVSEVHRGLAEQAFRSNAQNMLADGLLTKDKVEALKTLQGQLGLPDEAAQRVIKGITSGKAVANLQAQIATGKLTLEEVEAMAESGVDVGNAVSAEVRLALLRKEVERALTDGRGEWDAARWSDTAPAALKLEPAKAASEVSKIASEKRRNQLVQAVALLRQRDTGAVLKALANLRAATAALPGAPPLAWPVKEELMDLYSVAAAAGAPEEQLAGLAATLALDASTTGALRAVVAAGDFQLSKEDATEALY
jgi:hypothetical protein